MQRKTVWLIGLVLAMVGMTMYVRSALATPAAGFTASTLAMARFGSFDVDNHRVAERVNGPGQSKDVWLSLQKTHGASDLYVQSNVWAPGGTTGWHTHPGHSLILVTAGTVTAYEADDPGCRPHVYTAGMGIVDPGDGHVHLLRNEDTVEARTVAVQLIPAGAARRIDAEASAACGF